MCADLGPLPSVGVHSHQECIMNDFWPVVVAWVGALGIVFLLLALFTKLVLVP